MERRSIGARLRVVVLACALGAAACGSDDDASAGDAADSATAVDAGVVEPRILCSADEVAYLTYTSTHADVVEIANGPDNQIAGADGTPLVDAHAEVFAPGEQQVVVAYVGLGAGATWTLTDGDTTSTLIVDDEDAPPCPDVDDELPGQQVEPEGNYVFSAAVTRDADGRITDAVIDVTLFGHRAVSTCPSGDGWTALDRELAVTAEGAVHGTVLDQDDPSVARVRIDDPQRQDTSVDGSPRQGYTKIGLVTDATDVCESTDGRHHRSWSASRALLGWSEISHDLCVQVVEEGGREAVVEARCDTLPLTDGIRIRIG